MSQTQTTAPASARSIRVAGEQTWTQIGNYNYERRGEFAAGLNQLSAQVDQSITQLKNRRTSYAGDPNAWDAEMKRLDDARSYLQSMSTELANATSANWDQRRERVAQAWERMEDAYERANGLAQ